MLKNINKKSWVSDDIIKEIRSKRGRKSKKELEILAKYKEQQDELGIVPPEKKLKKRGRKPKGGKIIKEINKIDDNNHLQPNIILHLKCRSKLINEKSIINMDYNPNISKINAFNEISSDLTQTPQYFNIDVTQDFIEENDCVQKNENKSKHAMITDNGETTYKQNFTNYEYNADVLNENFKNKNDNNNYDENNIIDDSNDYTNENVNVNIKQIWVKLKELQKNLHNNIIDSNSACFWCTCSYENPTVYIPKHIIDNKYEVYGCFCMPECAAAYLFNEHLDTSTKWERYSLLNNMYKNIYKYEINIKPAPTPFYTIDKYLGNLTIEEYRKLSTKENVLLIVDKPMTRILPELHDENNETPKIYYNEHNEDKKKYKLKRNKPTINKMNTSKNWAF